MEEVDFFQKLGLGLGLGLAFQGVKMSTFRGYEPDGVQDWESDALKQVFWTKFGPKMWKK